MVDIDINKLNDTKDVDGVVDFGNLQSSHISAQAPPQASPEAFPINERPRPVEGEESPETFSSPKPPIPKSRERSAEEVPFVEGEDVEFTGKSEGRVVDMRGNNDTSRIETLDKLTKYGDQKEDEFIKGVESAHGPTES